MEIFKRIIINEKRSIELNLFQLVKLKIMPGHRYLKEIRSAEYKLSRLKKSSKLRHRLIYFLSCKDHIFRSIWINAKVVIYMTGDEYNSPTFIIRCRSNKEAEDTLNRIYSQLNEAQPGVWPKQQ